MRDLKDLIGDVYKDFYGESESGQDGEVLSADDISVENEAGKLSIKNGFEPASSKEDHAISNPVTEEEKNGQAVQPALQEEKEEKEPERSGFEELEELIGLSALKDDVKELADLVRTQKMREDRGMKTVPVSLHLVFSGNPGTGKTTIARILAKIYREIGVLSKGQLIETDRSGLVAGYVGQTALKTQEKIQEAMGGILFIDEAYTLARGSAMGDFGQEAIDTILKAMEDHRRDFVVIVAGYTDLMREFIDSNPGLQSRFNKYFYFEDYTAEELIGIFNLQCRKYEYELSEEAREKVEEGIRYMESHKTENFANARDIRNLFETIITNQARRVAKMEDPQAEDLRLILPEDLEEEKEETNDSQSAETDADEGTAEPVSEGSSENSAFSEHDPLPGSEGGLCDRDPGDGPE